MPVTHNSEYVVAISESDTSGLPFGNDHVGWNTNPLNLGTFLLGLNANVGLAFESVATTAVPKGATILSASITMALSGLNLLVVPARISGIRPSHLGVFQRCMMTRSFKGFRPQSSAECIFEVEDTGAVVRNVSAGSGVSRVIPFMNERDESATFGVDNPTNDAFAQGFTPTVNYDAKKVRVQIRRFGSFPGTPIIRMGLSEAYYGFRDPIYPSPNTDSLLNPGVPVFYSDNVNVNSISTGSGGTLHEFNFPTPVPISSSKQYVFWTEWVSGHPGLTMGGSPRLDMNIRDAFLTNNFFSLAGSTSYFRGAYTGSSAFNMASADGLDTDIPVVNWNIPPGTDTTSVTSPDITSMVQAMVDGPEYVRASALVFGLSVQSGLTVDRQFQAVEGPFGGAARARLNISWRKRRSAGGIDLL